MLAVIREGVRVPFISVTFAKAHGKGEIASSGQARGSSRIGSERSHGDVACKRNVRETNGRPAAPRPLVAPEIRELEERIVDASRWVVPLKREIGTVIVGQHALVDRLIVGLLANGHILLEGVPGLAKTLALKTLAGSIDGARFGRIQFTPDMLPSDIVGTTIYRAQTGTFEAKRGPVFANFVLADEINRAPAKVQSALLEAMQEHQVTLGDETFPLPDPFLVLATQNPLEQEGTYPLPEAQLDRFLMKVRVRYPDAFEERAILDSMAVTEPRTAVVPGRVARHHRERASRRRQGVRRRRGPRLHRSHRLRDEGAAVATTFRSRGFCAPARLRAARSGSRWPRAPRRFSRAEATSSRKTSRRLRPTCFAIASRLSFEAEASGVDGDEIVRRVLANGGVAMKANPIDDATQRISDRVRRIEIGTRRLSSDAFHGGVQSRFRGRGMDFDEVREYEPGDDVRAIDWSATARAGHTFVKKYREERQLTVVFVVDMSASGSLGSGDSTKREQAVEMAGVLALAAVQSDHRIGLVLFTDTVEAFVPPARGRPHAFRLVRDLVAFEPKGRGTNLASALRLVRERLRRRAVVVDPLGLPRRTRPASSKRDPSSALSRSDTTSSRSDSATGSIGELPSVGLLTLEDAETGEVVEVDTGSASKRARLEAIAQRRRRAHSLAGSERACGPARGRHARARISGRSSASSVPVEDEREPRSQTSAFRSPSRPSDRRLPRSPPRPTTSATSAADSIRRGGTGARPGARGGLRRPSLRLVATPLDAPLDAREQARQALARPSRSPAKGALASGPTSWRRRFATALSARLGTGRLPRRRRASSPRRLDATSSRRRRRRPARCSSSCRRATSRASRWRASTPIRSSHRPEAARRLGRATLRAAASLPVPALAPR